MTNPFKTIFNFFQKKIESTRHQQKPQKALKKNPSGDSLRSSSSSNGSLTTDSYSSKFQGDFNISDLEQNILNEGNQFLSNFLVELNEVFNSKDIEPVELSQPTFNNNLDFLTSNPVVETFTSVKLSFTNFSDLSILIEDINKKLDKLHEIDKASIEQLPEYLAFSARCSMVNTAIRSEQMQEGRLNIENRF